MQSKLWPWLQPSDAARRRVITLQLAQDKQPGADAEAPLLITGGQTASITDGRVVADNNHDISEPAVDEPITISSSVSSCSGSSDSAPVSRKARKYLAKKLQAKKHCKDADPHQGDVYKPASPKAPMVHEHGGPVDPLNLWKALSPRNNQYLDLEAKHDSIDDSEMSTRSICRCG
jgi:hypothetical protein